MGKYKFCKKCQERIKLDPTLPNSDSCITELVCDLMKYQFDRVHKEDLKLNELRENVENMVIGFLANCEGKEEQKCKQDGK